MSGSEDGRNGRRRRHRSRSRRHRGHRDRRREDRSDAAADASSYPPPTWPPGAQPNGPPTGWHGSSAGAGPPPSYGYALPGLPPMHPGAPSGAPPFGHPGAPPMMGMPIAPHQPEIRYEGVRDSPFHSPFSAVPPPAGLDATYRKGGKGKGKGLYGYGAPEYEVVQHSPQPDGLIASNVPTELNTLDVLNRHFRQFGEVLKITVQASEGKAFVQFAERASAEAAASAVVLERPEISLAWAQRGGLKGKGSGKDKHKGPDRLAENRVLCADPEEQRRLDANKRKRNEIADRKNALLANLTEQLKTIMSKLNAEDLPEARQEALRSMILQIKERMNSLSGEGGGPDEQQGKGKLAAKRQEAEAASGKGSSADGRYTLDLRPKVLRVSLTQGWTQERLREELAKIGATDDKIMCVHMEGASGSGQQPGDESALVQFKDRRGAEQAFNQKSTFPCNMEWTDKVPPAPVAAAALKGGADELVGDAAAADAPIADALTAETRAVDASAADVPVADAASAAATAPASESCHSAATGEVLAPADSTVEPASETAANAAGESEAASTSVDASGVAAAGPDAEPRFRVDLSEEEDVA